MEKTDESKVGGFERGTICEKKDDPIAKWVYKVESATRQGVKSRWMEAVSASVREYEVTGTEGPAIEKKYEYFVGDIVNFFMFDDGRGMILGKIRMDLD